ncbi:MAG: hypothetical protein GTN70_01700 [Deltaproteobacteria bacterium]|nr:hypothetical protein [Deltaproteobacteria bacterium]NIS76361.1 hypothetical protein [Deltaproteobacteria bacterium]
MKDLRTCSDCGYGNGFHLGFRGSGETVSLYLICPMCGESFSLERAQEALLRPDAGKEGGE